MSDLERRIDKLEQLTDPDRARVVVNWDTDPGPPGEGVIVVSWGDIGDGPAQEN